MPLALMESGHSSSVALQQRLEIPYNCAKYLTSPTGDSTTQSGQGPQLHTTGWAAQGV